MYVVVLRPSPFRSNNRTDCVDLLFRINPFRRSPCLPRLLRSSQRSPNLAGWKGDELRKRNWKWTTRYLHLFKCSTPDVHISSTRRIRDFIACCRIPRWTSRRGSQLVSATIWQRTCSDYQPRNQWTDKQRAATNAWGSCSANRVPIQSEGHLFLRGQPRRCQRDLVLEARNIRSLRRQREMVASQERKRRHGHSTIELLDPVIRRCLFSFSSLYFFSRRRKHEMIDCWT